VSAILFGLTIVLASCGGGTGASGGSGGGSGGGSIPVPNRFVKRHAGRFSVGKTITLAWLPQMRTEAPSIVAWE